MVTDVIGDLPIATQNSLQWAMFAVVGLCWNITYIGLIYRGFKDKIPGMPLPALALNFGWEFVMSFIYTEHLIPLEVWMNRVWVLLDVLLLWQELRYGRHDFAKSLPSIGEKLHLPVVAMAMTMGFFFTFLTVPEWHDEKNGEYAAFLMNVLMSMLFVSMLQRRRSIAGQSIYVALAKFIGTSVVGVAIFGIIVRPGTILDVSPSPLELFLGICCFVFDLTYIVLLARQYRADGIDLWTRRPVRASVGPRARQPELAR